MIGRVVIIAVFAAVGGLMVAATGLAHRPGSRLVPLGTLLATILQRRSVRIAILLFWWWAGWHFLVEP